MKKNTVGIKYSYVGYKFYFILFIFLRKRKGKEIKGKNFPNDDPTPFLAIGQKLRLQSLKISYEKL